MASWGECVDRVCWCEGGRRDREGVGDLKGWAEGRVGGRSEGRVGGRSEGRGGSGIVEENTGWVSELRRRCWYNTTQWKKNHNVGVLQ